MKTITVDATIENIPCVTAFIESELEEAGCPMEAVLAINVAMDELCSNVARYAYKGKPGTLTVRLEILKDPAAAKITLIDEGVPYDPLGHTDPDTALAADEGAIGGMGILIVKRIMTQLFYSWEEGRNKLTVIKNFEGEPSGTPGI